MADDNIVLSSGMRQNLLSLQNLVDMMNTTQNRLASGKKINSPIDGAVNFFTSQNLQSRANDLGALLDTMGNAIQTVTAASTGLSSIVTTIQSMHSTLLQARQDTSWNTTSFTVNAAAAGLTVDFSGGAVGTTPVNVALDDGAGHFFTVDELVSNINTNVSLQGKIKASNNAGKLAIANLSTGDLTVGGVSTAGGTTIDGTAANVSTIGGNTTRANLASQYNVLRDQLDKFSLDSSFNGINLLQGDTLHVVFDEQSKSSLDIQATDPNGNPTVVDSSSLGITNLQNSDLDSNTNIDTLLSNLDQSLGLARGQSSKLGSSLSIVQNRQNFTQQMVSTLKTGADNLVVADNNEESANMLALQTRQQLSMAALSLANQANQSVLRLFG